MIEMSIGVFVICLLCCVAIGLAIPVAIYAMFDRSILKLIAKSSTTNSMESNLNKTPTDNTNDNKNSIVDNNNPMEDIIALAKKIAEGAQKYEEKKTGR